MITCAPFAKSPNCASQIVSVERIGDAVAVLEAQHRDLREQAVVDLEARLLRREVRERHVLLARLLVDDRGVAVAEGAAAAVLAGEPHRRAFDQQRSEGERLAEPPIDRPVLGHDLAPPLEHRDELRVHREIRAASSPDRSESCASCSTGTAVTGSVLGLGAREAGPGAARLEGLVGSGRLRHDAIEGLAQLLGEIGLDALDVGPLQDAAREQLLGVELSHRFLVADLLVEQRLREARLVALVVAVAAIADHVDHDVLPEALAPLHRHLHAVHDGLGLVAVHVQDRHLDHLGDVRRVERRARFGRRRGEADLVVDDGVDRPAGRVAGEVREIQRLGDDALPREGGVAVDQHGDHAVAAQIARAPLLRARAPLDHGIDGLEVRRVRREREVHALPGAHHAVVRVALVVLDVARAEGAVDQRVVLELGEDRVERLAQRVREHVEAPAVRHPDHDLAAAVRRGVLDDRVEQRDQRFRAFEREALLSDELGVEEALEELRRRDVLEDAQALDRRERRRVRGILEPPLQPALAARILDVGELDADLAAVRGAQPLEDLAQRLHRPARKIAGDVGSIEIVAAEAVVGRVELGEVERLPAERIGVGDAVSARRGRRGSAAARARACRRAGLRSRHAGLPRRGRRRRRRGHGRRRLGLLEEFGPALVDRGGIDLVALADLLDEGGVHAEAGERVGDVARVVGFGIAAGRRRPAVAALPAFAVRARDAVGPFGAVEPFGAVHLRVSSS